MDGNDSRLYPLVDFSISKVEPSSRESDARQDREEQTESPGTLSDTHTRAQVL
jgi:hypothetical protein